jgi:hypothetical protein
MAAKELDQARSALLSGKAVCVLNLAAFSMAVGKITAVDENAGAVSLVLNSDKGEQVSFSLENPVSVVTTATGYRFDSSKLILQVDFMPE